MTTRFAWEGLAIGLCAVLIGVTLNADGVLSELYTQDIFFTLDSMQRGAQGDIPHRDFHTPIGQAFFWPFMLLAQFEPPSIQMMLHANALVAALLAILGVIALRARLSGPLLAIAVLGLVATALSPRDIGRDIDVFSHIAFYNRWGWSFLALVALIFTLSPSEGSAAKANPRDALIAGVVAGFGMAILCLLKITYFVGALGLLGLGLVMGKVGSRTALAAGATLLAMLGLTALLFGNLGAYYADLRMAVEANVAVDPLRLQKFRGHFIEGAAYGLVIVSIFWLRTPTFDPLAFARMWWRETVMTGALVLGGVVLATQNHPSAECPLFVVAVIAAAELARRKQAPPTRHVVWALRLALTGAAALGTPLLDSGAVLAHAAATHGPKSCALSALQGTPGAALHLPPRAFTAEARVQGAAISCDMAGPAATSDPWENDVMRSDAARLADAMNQLSRMRDDAVVFALDFGNPYPMLRRTPAPAGALIWWDPARNFSPQAYPDGNRVIASADVVLVPNADIPSAYYGEPLWAIYGPSIAAEFELVAQTPYWRVWARPDALAGE